VIQSLIVAALRGQSGRGVVPDDSMLIGSAPPIRRPCAPKSTGSADERTYAGSQTMTDDSSAAQWEDAGLTGAIVVAIGMGLCVHDQRRSQTVRRLSLRLTPLEA
jgi:hypothetical protein